MAPDTYLFLTLSAPCAAPGASALTGGPQGRYLRCLDTAGRWAVRSAAGAPWLAWHPTDAASADAAAQRTSQARGCGVDVVSHSDAVGSDRQGIQLFTEACEAALRGSEPLSAGRLRRMTLEVEKLEAFCLIVRAASGAPDQAAFAEVGRAAAKALQAKFGGGSITSAFAWLSSHSSGDAFDSLLSGELESAGRLSLEEMAQAIELAKQAERLQKPPGPR
jgi:hypothetical protein